jgi:hypothetical protein
LGDKCEGIPSVLRTPKVRSTYLIGTEHLSDRTKYPINRVRHCLIPQALYLIHQSPFSRQMISSRSSTPNRRHTGPAAPDEGGCPAPGIPSFTMKLP